MYKLIWYRTVQSVTMYIGMAVHAGYRYMYATTITVHVKQQHMNRILHVYTVFAGV